MKNKKQRFTALFMALTMAICCFAATTAFAADVQTPVGDEILPASTLDQTFTMTSWHQGSNRTYAGCYLNYSVKITNTAGAAVSDRVFVELHDASGTTRSSLYVTANGGFYGVNNISITPGATYYFTYTRTSGSSSLKVNMIITDRNYRV